MRLIDSVPALQRLALRWRRAGVRVGFVPTMGYLHAGHISLVHRARQLVGPAGVVVVSSYVNPTQFAPTEDLSRYPRDSARDRRLCRAAGVDVMFFPDDAQMYAGRDAGRATTFVVEAALSRGMEGASRPTHFRGVTTVVAKLFNIVLPEVAVFGAKDFQQAAVIRRMTEELNFPVRIEVAPTVREPDGLALSSRNQYLNAAQRTQATALWLALQRAQSAVQRSTRPLSAAKLERELRTFIERQPEARVDYVQFFDAETLLPVRAVTRGIHLALAVRVGPTRLIDNARL